MLDLGESLIPEPNTRESVRRVSQFIRENPLLAPGSTLLTLTFGKAETNLKIPHGLSFQPKDVIITSVTGGATVTVNYDLLDQTNLVVTSSAACTARLLVGTLGGS